MPRRVAESLENHPLSASADERLAIQAGQTRRVIVGLPLGFFKQRIWAPLHLISNCVIELTLGDKLNAFKAGESDSYDLSDVSLLGTCLHVDSAISAGDHQHLDASMPLPIAYQTVVGTKHIVTNGSFSLNLARALTRLKANYFVIVSAASANQGTDFVGRTNGDQVDGRTDVMNFHLQVGSQRFPDQPATGVAEHYYRLMQTSGQGPGPRLHLTGRVSLFDQQDCVRHQSGARGQRGRFFWHLYHGGQDSQADGQQRLYGH